MLKELLDDHYTGHSEFQDDYLITVRSGGTVYGQYKQALRELYKRTRGLRELLCNRDKLLVEIDQQKWLADKADDMFAKRFATIELKRKIMQQEESDRVIVNTKREFVRFYQQAVALKKCVGELTDDARKKYEVEFWCHQVKQMAANDFVAAGRLQTNTIDVLRSMPDDVRDDLHTEIISNQSALIDWYFNESTKSLPVIEENELLDANEILQLI